MYVFDADVHVHELDAELAPYFEEPWRRVLEQGGLVREGARNVRGERITDYPGYSPLTPYDPILSEAPTELPHRITSPEVLRADLDARGVEGALVFTGRLLRAAQSGDHNYLGVLMRAYNRLLTERWLDPSQGIYGAIMAANQLPEDAAEEIERYAATPGFIAVYLPMAGNYPLWGDRSYEPIFAAAAANDLPVVLQGGLTIHTVFPYQLHHLPTALAKHTLSLAFGAMANLVSLVAGGVLKRYPSLKVVVNDAGLGWLPYVVERLDHFYPYLKVELPENDRPPGEDIHRQVYLTTHPLGDDDAFTVAALNAIGAGHVLYGSDWPHFDADPTSKVLSLPISEEAKAGLLGENARGVFTRLGR